MNMPPLRPVTTLPVGRPGSELNTQRASRATRSMTGRDEGEAISSSDGDEAGERRRRAAEALEGFEHEGVHDEARLHVGDARAIGAAALDLEAAARHLALREHRVAMAHQHDRLLVRRAVVEADVDGVAEGLVRLDAGRAMPRSV